MTEPYPMQPNNAAPYGQPNTYGTPVPPYASPYMQGGQPIPPYGYAQQGMQMAPYDQQGYYGAPQPYYAPVPIYQAPDTGKATAALVCGILSIVFSSAGFGIIPGIIAIVLGNQYTKEHGKNGTAFAGKVTGIVGTALSVLMILLMIAYFALLFFILATYSSSYYY